MKVLHVLLVSLFLFLPAIASAAGALQLFVFGQNVPCDLNNHTGHQTNTTGGPMFVRGANVANQFPGFFGYTSIQRHSTGEVLLFVLNDGTSTVMLPSGSYILVANGEQIDFVSTCSPNFFDVGGGGGLSVVTFYFDTTLP